MILFRSRSHTGFQYWSPGRVPRDCSSVLTSSLSTTPAEAPVLSTLPGSVVSYGCRSRPARSTSLARRYPPCPWRRRTPCRRRLNERQGRRDRMCCLSQSGAVIVYTRGEAGSAAPPVRVKVTVPEAACRSRVGDCRRSNDGFRRRKRILDNHRRKVEYHAWDRR